MYAPIVTVLPITLFGLETYGIYVDGIRVAEAMSKGGADAIAQRIKKKLYQDALRGAVV